MPASASPSTAPTSSLSWFVALLLGSSTVATLVTKTWDYFAKYEMPAELVIVKIATYRENVLATPPPVPQLVLRNTGARTAVVVGLTIDDKDYDSFMTDRLLDRQRAPRNDPEKDPIYELQVAAAVPGDGFITILPVAGAPAKAKSNLCVSYFAGKEPKAVCGAWLPRS